MSGGNESAEACGIIPLTFIQTGDTQLYSAQRIRAQQSLVERQTSLWNVPLSALSASFLSDDQPLWARFESACRTDWIMKTWEKTHASLLNADCQGHVLIRAHGLRTHTYHIVSLHSSRHSLWRRCARTGLKIGDYTPQVSVPDFYFSHLDVANRNSSQFARRPNSMIGIGTLPYHIKKTYWTEEEKQQQQQKEALIAEEVE